MGLMKVVEIKDSAYETVIVHLHKKDNYICLQQDDDLLGMTFDMLERIYLASKSIDEDSSK